MYFIVLRSATAAEKARKILSGYKISSTTGKITTSKGCRFGIYTEHDPDKTCRLLSLGGLNCMEIRKPVSVLHSAEKALYDYGANPGRSGHRLSLETSRQVFYAREKCAEFFGGETENTVFTRNCTHAINFALKGVCNAKGHCHKR